MGGAAVMDVSVLLSACGGALGCAAILAPVEEGVDGTAVDVGADLAPGGGARGGGAIPMRVDRGAHGTVVDEGEDLALRSDGGVAGGAGAVDRSVPPLEADSADGAGSLWAAELLRPPSPELPPLGAFASAPCAWSPWPTPPGPQPPFLTLETANAYGSEVGDVGGEVA